MGCQQAVEHRTGPTAERRNCCDYLELLQRLVTTSYQLPFVADELDVLIEPRKRIIGTCVSLFVNLILDVAAQIFAIFCATCWSRLKGGCQECQLSAKLKHTGLTNLWFAPSTKSHSCFNLDRYRENETRRRKSLVGQCNDNNLASLARKIVQQTALIKLKQT